MTNKEVNDLIKTAKHPDWFKKIEININLPHLEIQIPKKGFTILYQYIAKQKKGWDRIFFECPQLPQKFINSKNKFVEILQNLESILNQVTTSDENQLLRNWNSGVLQQISELQSQILFTSDAPVTTFLLDLNKLNPNYFEGGYGFLFNNSSSYRNSLELSGAFMAYEFKFQESSNIPIRSRHEKSSINQLRNSFEKYFNKIGVDVNEFYSSTEEKVKTFDKSAIKFFKDKNIKFETWLKNSKDNEEEYNKYNLKRIKELESLYSEKLMLEKPADYWNTRASELKLEAKKWLKWLVGSIGMGVAILLTVLILISTDTLKELFSSVGIAIKWSIVFITLISFLAFAIKTFTKLTFSAYHLARDAEERKQLVFVYLALKQENAVESNERVLILQSIFSRADSGLLKEDSSPTMPSAAFIEKILNKQQ